MIRKNDTNRYYSPLLHLLAGFVFRITILCVMMYDTLVYRIRFYGRHHLHSVFKPGSRSDQQTHRQADLYPDQHSTGKGAFLISNHTLYLDPAIVAHAVLPLRGCFTAMEKTFAMPFIGAYIRFLGAFPLSGSIPFPIFISAISRTFHKRRFVHFFPEGELAQLNTPVARFKEGVFFLAFRFNVPVIPIVIIPEPRPSLGNCLNQFFCKVSVKILEPVYPSRFKKDGRSFRERVRLMADHCRNLICAEIETGRKPGSPRTGIFENTSSVPKAVF